MVKTDKDCYYRTKNYHDTTFHNLITTSYNYKVLKIKSICKLFKVDAIKNTDIIQYTTKYRHNTAYNKIQT
jgi:hypothetical protein